MIRQFTCTECNLTKPVQNSGGTGYATKNGSNDIICYDCADNEARRELLTLNSVVHYLDTTGRNLTTWSGGHLGRVVKHGSMHHWSRERFYVTIQDVHGQNWHGIGANGMWTTLKKSKQNTEAKQ